MVPSHMCDPNLSSKYLTVKHVLNDSAAVISFIYEAEPKRGLELSGHVAI